MLAYPKKALKAVLEKIAPDLLNSYQSQNNRKLFASRFGEMQNRFRQHAYGSSDVFILSGPFKGLKYIDAIVWGSITPKWLGSYESELAHIIDTIIATQYDVIIDVGSADGYYAAGLAFRLPKAHIYAYDVDEISRKQLAEMARINQLNTQITVGKFCHHRDITDKATGKTAMICDIEGFERKLLDPSVCPALKRIDILVELHESKRGDTATRDLIRSRFVDTHRIEEIPQTNRENWIQKFLPSTENPGLQYNQLKEATNENRSWEQRWLWMVAR